MVGHKIRAVERARDEQRKLVQRVNNSREEKSQHEVNTSVGGASSKSTPSNSGGNRFVGFSKNIMDKRAAAAGEQKNAPVTSANQNYTGLGRRSSGVNPQRIRPGAPTGLVRILSKQDG